MNEATESLAKVRGGYTVPSGEHVIDLAKKKPVVQIKPENKATEETAAKKKKAS